MRSTSSCADSPGGATGRAGGSCRLPAVKAGFFALASAATLYPKLPVLDLLLIENRQPGAMFLRGCPAAQDPSRIRPGS